MHLLFDVIQKSLESTETGLKKLIDKMPLSVEDAYEKILRRTEKSNQAQQAKQLLHMIVAAYRPLTLHEMNIAWTLNEKLEADEECRSYDDLDLPSMESFKTKIRNLCGLFINVVGQNVYLIHQTAKDFLVSKKLEGFAKAPDPSVSTLWKHSLCSVESNLILARICVSYLLFHEVNQECDNNSEGGWNNGHELASVRLRSYVDGILDYAASHWTKHFRVGQSQADKATVEAALEVCNTQSSRFRRWYWIYHSSMAWPMNIWRDIMGTDLAAISFLGLGEVMREAFRRENTNVNIRDKVNRTPLHWAAIGDNGDVVDQLLDKNDIQVNAQDNNGATPLLLAAMNGCDKVVKQLLNTNNVDVNIQDEEGGTPLSLAVQSGRLNVVKQLLEVANIDYNLQGKNGMTPLLWAVKWNDCELITQLLEKDGIDVNIQTMAGATSLYYAALCGHIEVVKQLLRNSDIDVNLEDVFGATPLSRAAWVGWIETVRHLLEDDRVDIDIKDNRNMMALDYARQENHTEIVQLLETAAKHRTKRRRLV